MRPIMRLFGLLVLGSLVTECMNSTNLGPRLKNVPACATNATTPDIQIDELPAWVLDRHTLTEWVGDDLVLVGGKPPQIQVALIEGSTGRIRGIPTGTIDLPRPEADWRSYHTLVGNHVVSLWHSAGGGAPSCPPGAPCAVKAPERVDDLRGVISVLP